MGVLSLQDFLSRMHELNDKPTDENEITIIASDVVELFPSSDTRETARVCAAIVQISKIEFNNIDYTKMLLSNRK